MFNSINSMKVEGRASSLASMLKRELAAAHIQKIARGFLTRLTRSIPLIKLQIVKETIMLSQLQLLILEEFMVLEVVNLITDIIIESKTNNDSNSNGNSNMGIGIMGNLGRSIYQLQGGVESSHLLTIVSSIIDDSLNSIIKRYYHHHCYIIIVIVVNDYYYY